MIAGNLAQAGQRHQQRGQCQRRHSLDESRNIQQVWRDAAVPGQNQWDWNCQQECQQHPQPVVLVRRFDDFHQRLGLSRTTLTNRLKVLEDLGVVERRIYQQAPDRYEYRSTRKGIYLFPVISALVNGEDKYYFSDQAPPIIRRHTPCGHDTKPVLTCPECHEEIDVREMRARKHPDSADLPMVERGPVAYPASAGTNP
jgi:DNA-binding HxlR family transcriptional regulator